MTSPSLNLSAVANPRVSYWLYFNDVQHIFLAPQTATFTALISNDGGGSWTTVSVFQRARTPWTKIEFRVQDYVAPSATVRVRFVAENRFRDPVEVLIDDFMVFAGPSGVSSRAMEPSAETASAPHRILSALQGSTGGWFFTISRPATVRAQIIDVQGRLVRNLMDESLTAGDHVLRWDGRVASGASAASGVYWVRLQSGRETQASKIVLTH
ncbi:MAG TPA: FlgD immunoglobulin-like domain containing protein [Candidatus Polarisedimenticolia bacterium]|nr:FlgD immunoglobulin-like domain containing protein [Candidatus Polarisedimenticolia bacterium]